MTGGRRLGDRMKQMGGGVREGGWGEPGRLERAEQDESQACSRNSQWSKCTIHS